VKELEKNVTDLEKLMTVKNRTGAEAVSNARQNPAPAAKPAPLKAAPATPVKKAAPPPPEPSLVETLMDNLNYVVGAAAVLLLAALGVAQRRKHKPDARKAPLGQSSILGVPPEPAHSLFAQAGGQSIDTNNSVFNSSFAPSASQLDTNEVDPVAEADVYIAYGRDAQAEEILKEALRTHPERYPVRLKLLEIYAARKDQRAFETQAEELFSLTRGQGDEWAQAAALGLSIDPLNPLYANAPNAGAAPLPASEERGEQALLAQQLEQSFRKDAPQAGLMADAAPTALPQASDAAAKAEDDHVLDFDLGGLSFEPVSTTEPIAMPGPDAAAQAESTAVPDLEFEMDPFTPAAAPAAPAVPAPAADESFDLAFDMDFDQPAATQTPAARGDKADDELALDLSLGGPQTDIDMADLAKEFDLPPLPGAPEDSAPATELKDPLFDLDAMNFELPATQAAAPAPDTGAHELKDPLFDLDAMNFDVPATPAAPARQQGALEDDPFALSEQPGAAAAAGAPMPRFDMSSIDLDLPPAEMDDGQPFAGSLLPGADLAGMETAGAGAGEMSAAHMEMETKLDLAIAYQEIGDKEGARELLDEVIKGGNSEQVSKANAMRAKLA
jgi:pilus assembly protein FimV